MKGGGSRHKRHNVPSVPHYFTAQTAHTPIRGGAGCAANAVCLCRSLGRPAISIPPASICPIGEYISAAELGRGEDDVGAPNVLLRRAAIQHDRLKPMAVGSCDVHNNSCSHVETLNCFARFGNRPNESDH